MIQTFAPCVWVREQHPFHYITMEGLPEAQTRELAEWIKNKSTPLAQLDE